MKLEIRLFRKKRKEKEIHLRAVNCKTFDFQSDVLFSMSLFQSNRRIRDTFRYVVKQLAISIRCCPSLNIRMSGTEWRDASVGIFNVHVDILLRNVQTMASGESVALIFRQVIHCGNCVVGLQRQQQKKETRKLTSDSLCARS
ncbi:Uncharacterized protein APZ42_016898 [Daphnia magna]|uniref:Uncharacterized protein n=1 Tax=Daphnia magna TaxID=35525 RepID=A0A165A7G1_9CRUS|nr:Uncharacterized protein APZ42_016898 [Daphnia magna]